MSFRIKALEPHRFAPYFAMPDDEMSRNLARRIIATSQPGFPCRVSLADAEIGDELILVHFAHQDGASPYRASHAVYVRRGVLQARPAIDEIPDMLASRLLSVRAFDVHAAMVDGDVVDGPALGPALDRMLAGPEVDYVHIHFAKRGCYAARADRVG